MRTLFLLSALLLLVSVVVSVSVSAQPKAEPVHSENAAPVPNKGVPPVSNQEVSEPPVENSEPAEKESSITEESFEPAEDGGSIMGSTEPGEDGAISEKNTEVTEEESVEPVEGEVKTTGEALEEPAVEEQASAAAKPAVYNCGAFRKLVCKYHDLHRRVSLA